MASYSFVTANDNVNRDPTAWTLGVRYPGSDLFEQLSQVRVTVTVTVTVSPNPNPNPSPNPSPNPDQVDHYAPSLDRFATYGPFDPNAAASPPPASPPPFMGSMYEFEFTDVVDPDVASPGVQLSEVGSP